MAQAALVTITLDVYKRQEEKRAVEVETAVDNDKTESFIAAAEKAGNGIKNFFVHCGYFCTNVSAGDIGIGVESAECLDGVHPVSYTHLMPLPPDTTCGRRRPATKPLRSWNARPA